jgi:hypothetical protein
MNSIKNILNITFGLERFLNIKDSIRILILFLDSPFYEIRESVLVLLAGKLKYKIEGIVSFSNKGFYLVMDAFSIFKLIKRKNTFQYLIQLMEGKDESNLINVLVLLNSLLFSSPVYLLFLTKQDGKSKKNLREEFIKFNLISYLNEFDYTYNDKFQHEILEQKDILLLMDIINLVKTLNEELLSFESIDNSEDTIDDFNFVENLFNSMDEHDKNYFLLIMNDLDTFAKSNKNWEYLYEKNHELIENNFELNISVGVASQLLELKSKIKDVEEKYKNVLFNELKLMNENNDLNNIIKDLKSNIILENNENKVEKKVESNESNINVEIKNDENEIKSKSPEIVLIESTPIDLDGPPPPPPIDLDGPPPPPIDFDGPPPPPIDFDGPPPPIYFDGPPPPPIDLDGPPPPPGLDGPPIPPGLNGPPMMNGGTNKKGDREIFGRILPKFIPKIEIKKTNKNLKNFRNSIKVIEDKDLEKTIWIKKDLILTSEKLMKEIHEEEDFLKIEENFLNEKKEMTKGGKVTKEKKEELPKLSSEKQQQVSIAKKTLKFTNLELYKVIEVMNKEKIKSIVEREGELEIIDNIKTIEDFENYQKSENYNENLIIKYGILTINENIINLNTIDAFISMSPNESEKAVLKDVFTNKKYEDRLKELTDGDRVNNIYKQELLLFLQRCAVTRE